MGCKLFKQIFAGIESALNSFFPQVWNPVIVLKSTVKNDWAFEFWKLNYSPQPPHEGTNLGWRCFVFIRKYRGITVHLSMPCTANLGTGIKVARLRQVFKFKLVTANELKPSQLENAEMKQNRQGWRYRGGARGLEPPHF